MLTDHEAPAPPPQQWSLKKITLWCFGILLIFAVAILAYDEKLQPYDDLLPSGQAAPAGTNGYDLLKERWGGLADFPWEDQTTLSQMFYGEKPWDAAFADQLLSSHDHLVNDLREALQRTNFILPVVQTPEDSALDRLGFMVHAHNLLLLELEKRERSGERGSALNFRKDLHELTRRSLEGGHTDWALLWGVRSYGKLIIDTCQLLDQLKPDAGYAAELAELWRSGPSVVTAWNDAVRSQTALGRHRLIRLKEGGGDSEENRKKWWKRLLVKRNMTLNRLHDQRRNLIRDSFVVRSSAPDWDGPDPDDSKEWLRYLDANYYGKQWLDGEGAFSSEIDLLKNEMLFNPRALRVRIAIYRWQLQHPGAWPATLQELVPAYLPEIPADPWTGQPLTWDAETKTITAVGSDWTEGPANFHPASRSWFADDRKKPGLRMERPPLPAPASVKPSKAPSAAPAPAGPANAAERAPLD